MAEGMGRDGNACDLGLPRQAADEVLQGASRQDTIAIAEEEGLVGLDLGACLEVEPEGTPGGGIEGDLTFLAPLAVAHPHAAGAFPEDDVRDAEGNHLADAEPGLQQELDDRIVAFGVPPS